MAIKLTEGAYRRFAILRIHDSAAFDALRKLLAEIDDDPACGHAVSELTGPSQSGAELHAR